MCLLNDSVILKWNSRNKKYYETLGYVYTKMNDEFEVDCKDLSLGSSAIVQVVCDNKNCKSKIIKEVMYKDYVVRSHSNGEYYCNNCAKELYANNNTKKTKLQKSISFEQWCMNNNRKDILSRWDYDLNNCNPSEISYKSRGKSYQGYWFKCPQNIHSSELKYVNNFTKGCLESMACKQCNSVGYCRQNLVKYFADKKDSYKYSVYSSKKVLMKCPLCGNEKRVIISSLTVNGFSCPKCGDRISYPEKIMFNVLEQLGIEFQKEKTFHWSDKKRYDFYIPSLNCIIETHGMQHYESNFKGLKWKTLEDEVLNDIKKESLAKYNKVKYYIVIDCRYSDLEWIKNNILKSSLSNMFDLTTIDWLLCETYALKTIIKSICDLWNTGRYNITMLSEKFKTSDNSIRRSLKRGNKLGWCNYYPIIGQHIDINEVLDGE